ncbi:PhzF family phenazine biosynthesis protein [Oxyplasma meridianum]|uniref:PhzF family phenazine biosynthesis protein n=1 Tax=Oxyplasma meridianum TaxID=3073602 RepID=A0AAX4NGZ5_9ARCH
MKSQENIENHNLKENLMDFTIVDVFAERPFEGNQLAVVRTDIDLTTEQMMAVTREFGFSETTFIRRNNNVNLPIPVRIFGLEGEMKFAGHPSIGTASVIARGKNIKSLTLKLGIGDKLVNIENSGKGQFFEMEQGKPEFMETHSKEDISQSIGINAGIIDPELPVETVSTGNTFVIVPIRNLQDLAALKITSDRSWQYLKDHGAMHFYLVSRQTLSPSAVLHARMIYEKGEDPATGSAAGPAAAYMLKHGILKSMNYGWIEQGFEIGRPSMMRVRGRIAGDSIEGIKVAGRCFHMAEGKLSSPF